ncbi:MAG: tetratricopeptide repeat protein [Bacteroidia bacterium]|nr:tetratricopeptide repeat protein [Bacteroidia bacterium]
MMRAFKLYNKHTKFFLILASISLLSCSKQKDTLPARLYHTTTSYFNWYYNANELFKESVGQLEQGYKYPELGFIDVVYYGKEKDGQSMKSNMETIIKKNDAVLFKHPNGNYIDECRLLNGKCWFYTQEYSPAIQNFEFVIDKFPDSEVLADAYLYLAKTYYRMDNKIMAKDILEQKLVNNDTLEFSNRTYGELGLFRTRLAIEDEEYDKALEILQKHLEFVKGYDRLTKANYLLAQLLFSQKKYTESKYKFEEVAKMSRNYDLTFSAKLAIARIFLEMEKADIGKGEDPYRYLTKLLKDEKNREYQDQIYYQFALIALEKGKRDEGLDLLRKSVTFNLGNQRQKALSYYKIGQINFYELNDYPVAQAYYDSAAKSIRPEDPEHDEIKNLAQTLGEYIGYLETIRYQDSMLYVASLSKEELDKIVDKLVEEEERKKEEEAKALLASSNEENDPFFNEQLARQGRNNNRNNGGVWYFDDPGIVSQGKNEFQGKWGSRRNEDHWRRSTKAQTGTGNNSTIAGKLEKEGVEKKAEIDSSLVKEYGDKAKFYSDIPSTDEAKEAAHLEIQKAYYGLGQLYYQKLQEPDSAVESFETLLEKYPETEYFLQTRYALYKLYREELRIQAYRVHMDYILNNHPNTVYAYLILGKDPNDLKKGEEDFYFAYDGLQKAYENKEYESSLGFSEFLLTQEKFITLENVDVAKVKYIRGMSYGYLQDKDSLFAILTRFVGEYPEHGLTPMAKKTLGYMQTGIPEDTGVSSLTDESGNKTGEALLKDPKNPDYAGFSDKLKTKEKIFVIFYVDKTKTKKEALKSKISNFNNSKFSGNGLKVYVFLYKQTHWLPYIASFKNLEAAKDYLDEFREDPIHGELIKEGDKIMYMSHTNFKVAYGQKRMANYLNYYEHILGEGQ